MAAWVAGIFGGLLIGGAFDHYEHGQLVFGTEDKWAAVVGAVVLVAALVAWAVRRG